MDGARPLRRMFDIQIPLLTPTLFFLLVLNITDSFQDSFGIVDIMTGGGPARATNLMVYKIYFDGFKGLDYSGAAAQSIILMLLVIGLTFIQFRYIERRVHYTTEAAHDRTHAPLQHRQPGPAVPRPAGLAAAVRRRDHRGDAQPARRQRSADAALARARISSPTWPRPGPAPISASSS